MMKKTFVFLLAAALALSGAGLRRQGAWAAPSGATPVREYSGALFADVGEGSWYAPYIKTAYEYALMDGKREGAFDPDGGLTAAEAIKLAVTLHMMYFDKELVLGGSETQLAAYTEAAIGWGITEPLAGGYEAPATRAQFAELIRNALPPEEYAPIGAAADYCIPDVSPAERGGAAVYALYRAGILVGDDEYGLFRPEDAITRAQAAEIAARAAVAGYRAVQPLPYELSASEIYKLHSQAVMQIDTYDAINTHIRTGSAFFVSSSGLAVTNLHILEYSDYAVATLADGSQRDILGIVAYDEQEDVAILNVEGDGYSRMKFADSSSLEPGAAVYVISSPYGLTNTLTGGIVSQPLRAVDGQEFIQFTAQISFGSGGAPLIDSHGFVVGIASSSFSGAQSLNLAVPINSATGGSLSKFL
ncbi:MAG: trypsin-like peptidase domain-containing protein [Oscillospiraceae bacterium]|jgi:hypothetical protein|nr:trypsin-like peptidase domain-containing protein [Oscillospiraceae bacterium]